jgi:hypothetical protein
MPSRKEDDKTSKAVNKTHSFMIQEEGSVSVFDEVLLTAAAAHGVALFAGEAINRGAMKAEYRIRRKASGR